MRVLLLVVALLGLLARAQAQAADWAACDLVGPPIITCSVPTSTCTGGFCIPTCASLALGAKCYDAAIPDVCTGPNPPDRGCPVNDITQNSVMAVNCDAGTLCANTADPNPNLVCFDSTLDGFPWAPCPVDLACIPGSTNNLGVDSAQSYCRAACTEGPKTGLLSFQCRVWGKNTCWCPDSIFYGFPTDTACDVMTTPPVDGRSATVGSWANTYCTPASSYPEIDDFMSGLIPPPTCPTVTMTFQATGIPAFTETYEQCRKNGVPICACSAGTCDVFNEPITGRKVGTWSNTYCTP